MIFDIIKDCLLDCVIDSIKLLPFLFFTYLLMEYVEHKAGGKLQNAVSKAGKTGPVIGALVGAFPQCGFSAAASNFYAGRIITVGTLISVFLSTSDEMLPIMLSRSVSIKTIGMFILPKIIIGMIAGFVIDYILRNKKHQLEINHICEQHHCHCEEGIIKSALHHTVEIFLYIFGLSFAINLIIAFIGEEALAGFILNKPLIGEILAGIIGLIPNCAGSVVVTELYLENVISYGAALSGLLAGSGVGILVLFRVNDNHKDNLKILGLTYGIAVIAGCIIGLFVK